MANYCGECTYLDLNTGDIYGKFYCEKHCERHLSTDINCNRFCKAYSRDSYTIKNAYNFSNEKNNSGCYITTIMCNILGMPDNNPYLETIRNFRNNYLQKNNEYKALLVEYDIIGPKIAHALNNDPLKERIAKNYFNAYINPITNLINSDLYIAAINIYKQMTNSLKDFYSLNNIYPSNFEIDNTDINESGHGIYKQKKVVPNK